jgi:hypothetical protein
LSILKGVNFEGSGLVVDFEESGLVVGFGRSGPVVVLECPSPISKSVFFYKILNLVESVPELEIGRYHKVNEVLKMYLHTWFSHSAL